MKLDNLSAFSKHLRGAFPDHLLPVYMILSKDADMLAEGVRQFRAIVAEGERALSVTAITLGTPQQLNVLFEEIASRTFFAPKRLICANGVEKMKKEELAALSSALVRKEPSVTLLLSGASDVKLKSLQTAVEKEGMVLSLAEMKAWQKEKALADWLIEQAAERKKRLERGVVEELLMHTGQDRGALLQELEKLITYVDERATITLDDVRLLAGAGIVDSIWEFYDTLFAKNGKQTLMRLHSLLEEGLEPIAFIRQLRSQVQTYFALSDLLQKGATEREISEQLPKMQGFILKKNKEKVSRFSSRSFRVMLAAVDEVDVLLRTSIPNPSALLDRLIATICQLP